VIVTPEKEFFITYGNTGKGYFTAFNFFLKIYLKATNAIKTAPFLNKVKNQVLIFTALL